MLAREQLATFESTFGFLIQQAVDIWEASLRICLFYYFFNQRPYTCHVYNGDLVAMYFAISESTSQ